MKKLKILVFMALCVNIYAQQFTIKGKITDATTSQGLLYGNLRVLNTTIGTSANIDGNYEIKLSKGYYKLIASYIGYISDTVEVNLDRDRTVNFKLKPVSINLPEVTVIPGYNPAIPIIKKAIEYKEKREKEILSYEFTAYTKGAIRTTQKLQAGNNNISIGVGDEGDSSALTIAGILENQSKGYYKKPNNYKEEIIARKQSANFPPTINLLTGGRIIQNFYIDDIRFFDRPIPSPIGKDALDYYYYYLEDSLAMDNNKVYKIYFAPEKDYYPGFVGNIYIIDGIFALIKTDVSLNKAANTAGIFTKINIFQQYVPFNEDIYMPIDYRLFIEANVLGLARIGFELNSIMYDYKVNTEIDDDFFDYAIITVTPEADKRDINYWSSVQTIPNTNEETEAYKRIDSLEAIPKTFWDKFSFLATNIQLNDTISISGPLNIYSFNRVEGHSVNFGLEFSKLFNSYYYGSMFFGYGFSDKKFKYNIDNTYYLGTYRNHSIYFNIYDKTKSLFEESVEYNTFTSTVLSLFTKYDFRNYYRSKGFEAKVKTMIFPFLTVSAGFINNTDFSLINRTDFSFFKKDKKYPVNLKVNDGKFTALKYGFELDFRPYIIDGLFIRRVGMRSFYATLSGDITYSNNKIIKTESNFALYNLKLAGRINTFRSAALNFEFIGVSAFDKVPMQYMYSLPGNISSAGKDFSFRTLNVGEVFGDRVFTAFFEHSFRDELFKLLAVPFLKTSEINLNVYFNTAISKISDKGAGYVPYGSIQFIKPFYEAGFSLGHPILPFKFEFTWKLNYKGNNNFTFGINTILL
jgi:hypothetical protein